MARKSQITVTSRADAAKTQIAGELRVGNEVLAKRLRSGNLQGGGSIAVPLKEPERWYTRIENQLADPNMFYRMRHELGYEPLTPDDLACKPSDAGFRVSEDGYLVRGPAGQEEMVFKMLHSDRAVLDTMYSESNKKGIGSSKTVKADMAEAAGAAIGAEAGDYISGLQGSVVDRIAGLD